GGHAGAGLGPDEPRPDGRARGGHEEGFRHGLYLVPKGRPAGGRGSPGQPGPDVLPGGGYPQGPGGILQVVFPGPETRGRGRGKNQRAPRRPRMAGKTNDGRPDPGGP